MASIGIIDYGMGNLHSIAKAVERVAAGHQVKLSYDPDELRQADRLIFPGVGAIAHCMDELQRLELDDMLREIAGQKPLLGVCLGMQALLAHSEENDGVDCVGVIPGQVRRFAPDDAALKVPHMGWNRVTPTDTAHPLWHGIAPGSWFYFVHSFYAAPEHSEDIAASADYGQRFCCALLRDNLFAVQFHPEKSQAAGLALLANFVQWNGQA